MITCKPRSPWLILMAACTLLATGLGLFAYLQVPAGSTVAIHFDSSGNPNGWANPLKGFFSIPLMMLAFLALQWAIPIFKPTSGKIEQKIVGIVFVGVGMLLVFAQAVIVVDAFRTLPAA